MDEYLNEEMLINIEDKISELHNLFKGKYGQEETFLSTAVINNNLDGRVLHLNIPYDFHQLITSETITKVITFENEADIRFYKKGDRHIISVYYQDIEEILYSKDDYKINNDINYIRFKLPKNMGRVTAFAYDTENEQQIYKAIKKKDNNYKLLAFTKKAWGTGDIPTLQEIDRIEEGINAVAEMVYEPIGYQHKDWTTTGYLSLKTGDFGLAQKPISLLDFERWEKNIDLLKKAMDDIINIWNVVSYIDWDIESNFEWED